MSFFDFGGIGFDDGPKKKRGKKEDDIFSLDGADFDMGFGGEEKQEVLTHGKKKFLKQNGKLIRLTKSGQLPKSKRVQEDDFGFGSIGISGSGKDSFSLFGGSGGRGSGKGPDLEGGVKKIQKAQRNFNRGRESGSDGLFKAPSEKKQKLVGVSEAVGIGVGKLQKKLHERKMRLDEEKDQQKRRFVSKNINLGRGQGELR